MGIGDKLAGLGGNLKGAFSNLKGKGSGLKNTAKNIGQKAKSIANAASQSKATSKVKTFTNKAVEKAKPTLNSMRENVAKRFGKEEENIESEKINAADTSKETADTSKETAEDESKSEKEVSKTKEDAAENREDAAETAEKTAEEAQDAEEKKEKTDEEIEEIKKSTAEKARDLAGKAKDKTINAAKRAAPVVAAGAAVGAFAGRGIATGVGAGVKHVKEGGLTNLFFFMAMFFHIIDSLSNYSLVQLRLGIYFALGIIGWLVVFRDTSQSFVSRESWAALIKSMVLATLAFFMPLILTKYISPFLDENMINIILAVWPIYLIWFVFLEVKTPLLHSIQKIIIFVWLIIAIMNVYAAVEAGTLQNIPALQNTVDTDFFGALGNVWQLFKNAIMDIINLILGIPDLIKEGFASQVKHATGEDYHYSGQEEQEEQLGIFIEDIELSDPLITVNESVELWGILKVRTASKNPINIRLSCNSSNGEGEMSISEFTIIGNDEQDIDCTFKKGFNKTGSKKINFFANYNFKTSAYLKTYFMDEERKKIMRRADIDHFREYGITEKIPIPIYTNGPIKLGIDTTSQPIGVSDEMNPKVGFTVENTWEGEIKEITNIEISLPQGLYLNSENCDYSFEDMGDNTFKLKEIEQIGEIKEYRSFNCRTKLTDSNSLLGDVPLSTKYFRVSTDYLFESETSKTISIKK
ncbi:hypothetical protein ISS04_00235 [Candidatus Woesearchaeota archaeon]|nr:hypothetical protein [Candidatus Woesearchaeota archaeon]